MTHNARYIGDSVREAVTWTQEHLRASRPVAENTIWSAITAGAVVWDDGVYLLEDDDELEKRKISSVQTTQKTYNAAKKWTRLHFRNQNRSKGAKKSNGKNSLMSVHKNAASKFSSFAEDMLTGTKAALPSGSNAEEDDPSK